MLFLRDAVGSLKERAERHGICLEDARRWIMWYRNCVNDGSIVFNGRRLKPEERSKRLAYLADLHIRAPDRRAKHNIDADTCRDWRSWASSDPEGRMIVAESIAKKNFFKKNKKDSCKNFFLDDTGDA
jgi:hypothetical protein